MKELLLAYDSVSSLGRIEIRSLSFLATSFGRYLIAGGQESFVCAYDAGHTNTVVPSYRNSKDIGVLYL